MKKSVEKWGHDALAKDLASHLETPERMIWTDMQLGPSGSARPDVYSMRKSYSKPMPVTYEIKVSVSDFRSDITSGKWQKYLDFSTAVVFAVPKGLIGKDDIPKGCGLMTRGENGWVTLRKPTRQTVTLPEKVMLKLLIDGVERARRPKPQEWNQYITDKKIKAKYGDDVANALKDISRVRREEQNIKSVIDQNIIIAQARAERITEDAKLFREKQQAVLGDVCRALGMETVTSSVWQIEARAAQLMKMANESHVIRQACIGIDNAIKTLSRCKSSLPEIDKEDAA